MDITTLCLDFGNTRLKYAVFQNEDITASGTFPDESENSIKKVLEEFKPERTLLSSVISHSPRTVELLREYTDLKVLGAETKIPFHTPVTRPETIGADRLAISAYACNYYPNQNNLVIALGSCITYNFINKYHYFLGGSISPGIDMRLKSMHEYTALLPLIKLSWEFPLIGYDTRTNLLSGVVLGMAEEINGIIQNYQQKFLNFNVLLTGGNTADFAPHIKYKIFADPELIMKGLYAISKFNYEN